MKTNQQNTGKPFEREIEGTLAAYQSAGIMRLQKTDPPTRVIFNQGRREIIFTLNPWLDYCGCWTERGGRALLLEAKSTDDRTLPCFQKSSGLTRKQLDSLTDWDKAGAAVGVLWRCGDLTAFIPVQQIRDIHRFQRRSVRFKEFELIKQGLGFLFLDFAANLADAYPKA